MSDWLRDLFKRKPTFADHAMNRADQEIAKARDHLEQGLSQIQQQLHERYAEIERIATKPVCGFTWTPVMSLHGQILALAWKNDRETAEWLLEEPMEGRA